MDPGNACVLYSSNIIEKYSYHTVATVKNLEARLNLAEVKNAFCFVCFNKV